MDHEGFVTTIAEVAIAIAGFSGIVAVLGGRSEDAWSEHDRARLRLLLLVSFNTVIGSFLPMFLFAAGFAEIWRVASGIWFIYITGTVLYRIPQLERTRRQAPSETPGWFFGVMIAVTAAIQLLQLVNVLHWATAWPYLLGLLEGLVLGFISFVRLLHVLWVSE